MSLRKVLLLNAFLPFKLLLYLRPVSSSDGYFGISAEHNMTPTNNLFDDENVLHTPMIQEDQTDPLKKFFGK